MLQDSEDMVFSLKWSPAAFSERHGIATRSVHCTSAEVCHAYRKGDHVGGIGIRGNSSPRMDLSKCSSSRPVGVQKVKVLSHKPADMGLIPRTHKAGSQNPSHKLVL